MREEYQYEMKPVKMPELLDATIITVNEFTHKLRRCLNCMRYIRRAQPLTFLKSTGHVMHQQFNIQQLYVLPTLYLCVLYLSENKQRLMPLTA